MEHSQRSRSAGSKMAGTSSGRRSSVSASRLTLLYATFCLAVLRAGSVRVHDHNPDRGDFEWESVPLEAAHELNEGAMLKGEGRRLGMDMGQGFNDRMAGWSKALRGDKDAEVAQDQVVQGAPAAASPEEPRCGKNARFNACAMDPSCEVTCEDRLEGKEGPKACNRRCYQRCVCVEGFLPLRGFCVTSAECDAIRDAATPLRKRQAMDTALESFSPSDRLGAEAEATKPAPIAVGRPLQQQKPAVGGNTIFDQLENLVWGAEGARGNGGGGQAAAGRASGYDEKKGGAPARDASQRIEEGNAQQDAKAAVEVDAATGISHLEAAP